MRHLALIVSVFLIHAPARALDAQVIAELSSIRQAYWDLLMGPHWATRNYRTDAANRAAIERIVPEIKMLDRMFGADSPGLSRALAGLGGLPPGRDPVGLIDQRESLLAQYDQIDRFIKISTGEYDPSWRETRFGKELTHQTLTLIKKYHHYDRIPGAFAKHLTEWRVAAAMLARFAPDPAVAEILASMVYLIERPPRGHETAPASVRMRVVLEASRALIDVLDTNGLDECRGALSGRSALPAPLRALPAPPKKS